MTNRNPKELLGLTVAGYRAAIDTMDATDKAAFGRLWFALISHLFGSEYKQDEVDEIIDTMGEMLDSRGVTAYSLKIALEESPELAKWSKYVGEKVREAREIADLTQMALAERANISQAYLSKLENGWISPSHKALKKIANALGIGIREFDPCSNDEVNRGD